VTPLLIISVVAGVTAAVLAIAAVHYARQAQLEYEELRERVPQAAHLADLEQRIDDRTLQLEEMAGKLAEYQRLEALIPGLERAVADLEHRQASLEPARQQHIELQAALEAGRESLRTTQGELHGLRQEHERLLSEAEKCRREADLEQRRAEEARRVADTHQLEAAESARALEQLKTESAAVRSNALAELRGLEAQIREAELKAHRLGIELQQKEQQLAESVQQLETVNRQISQLQMSKVAMEESVANLRSQKSGAESELARLKHELVAAAERKNAAEREVARLEQQIESLTRQRTDLATAVATTAQNITGEFEFASAFESMAAPIIHSEGQANGTRQEEEALQTVTQYAEQLGFQYSDRVLRAFHTSLKLGGHSPLLVLAGISGTGKSQLPRIYADALGIHFLQVPVQPGWDSPADLLGFFSHIERKFKPTPLARALVQMDPYSESRLEELTWTDETQTFIKSFKRHPDEMLLVLLDEMNLARVEYYFSDFLSRMEIRNAPGFLEDNPDHRARAEFALEAPGARGGLQSLPLFVGRNVLFVGTMNEDESTMSLSDKVLDRANVLRFGKPTKLSTAVGRGTQAREAAILHRKQWHRWCAVDTGGPQIAEAMRKIDAWTQSLNDALDRSHRPFAHRTAAAIKAYCLAYPRGTQPLGDAIKIAFADQLEQRVMPRLRGLDSESAEGRDTLESVSALADELGDTTLREAIERGRQSHGGGSFAWYGVVRDD
jgi:predicted  nucleic acid-binding Zn-ribbon protein